MREARGQTSLLLEAPQELRIGGELRKQDLDCHTSPKTKVFGLVHTGHPALAQYADQAISSAEHIIVHAHKGSMRPGITAN